MQSCSLRRFIAGSLSRSVPFDQLFLHPFKNEVCGTFNGMIEHEREPGDE